MGEAIARQALATGDPEAIARTLTEALAAPSLQIAFVFGDRRIEPAALADLQRALAAPVVGCSALGVIGPGGGRDAAPVAVALGLYGPAVRAGVGVAGQLSQAALRHGRDAVHHAAGALGVTADALDPARHVAITLVDGSCGHEEAFCIGTAGCAPKIRFVGGAASSPLDEGTGAALWANGRVLSNAGVVVVLDSEQPFHAITSSHLVPTEVRTVVTGARGRVLEELDGRPAATRLRQLVASLGEVLDEPRPSHAFARYIDGMPYVRSVYRITGDRLILANAVETGHVLHVMRPGDLVQTTARALAGAAERVGGAMAAFLAFSGTGRHAEADLRATDRDLAAAFAAHPAIGFQTLGEQSGMLLVNHTLTGLAIGAPKP